MRFADKRLERFWESGIIPSQYPQGVARTLMRKLQMLDAAEYPQALRTPPGNRFEELSGDLASHYSVRVNRQWRLVFRWDRKEATDVRFVDYH
ncbi:type II toxin-antitoxin system RelE/ParE family toxin [Bifidobacterium lemurum]|nr:type II toxin-antitoxin system RelE/ParE family toxin [Bifidobacterium lemurum]